MPRDFVPCLYTEREMYDEVSQTWHRRYEVTEVFATSDIVTHAPLLSISGDSHAYCVGHAHTDLERRLAISPHWLWVIDRNERTRLFTTFYAAMAALE